MCTLTEQADQHIETAMEHLREALYYWSQENRGVEDADECWLAMCDVAERLSLISMERCIRKKSPRSAFTF